MRTYGDDVRRDPPRDVPPRACVALFLGDDHAGVRGRRRALVSTRSSATQPSARLVQRVGQRTHGLRASAMTALFVGTSSVHRAAASANWATSASSRAYA